MKIIDRYIARTVISAILMVMLVLVAIFSFFEFIDELDSLGRGRYGITEVIQYVLLKIPGLTYSLFPMGALIGSLMGLGTLVASSEMTVIRAAGVSLPRTVMAVMKAATLVILLALVVGEFIAPYTQQQANTLRSVAMADQITLKSQYGFWARDGHSYINIRKILPGDRIENIQIYEFDDSNRLRVSTHAEAAEYRDGAWLLQGIEQTELQDERVVSRQVDRAAWGSLLSPDLINVVVIKPQNLTLWGLVKYIRYLRGNAQNTLQYEQALWVKLSYPLAIAAMVFLAIPIVLSGIGTSTTGQRIMLGALIGLVFHIVNQASSQLGLLLNLNQFLSAVMPTLLVVAVGLVLMQRTA